MNNTLTAMKSETNSRPPHALPAKPEDVLSRLASLLKPNSSVILFPDGTRARISEFETYQLDGHKDSPNGVMVRLRSGRTLLWSVAGSTNEQRSQYAQDILSGLDVMFGRKNLAEP